MPSRYGFEKGGPMSRSTRLLLAAVAPLLAVILAANAAYAAVWSSTDKFGSWSNGGYTLYNDVWGSGAGPQTIWANSFSNWGVWANHPNTGGVKSYPHSARNVGRNLSALRSVTR